MDEERTELLAILRELHMVSGFRMSIYDTKFREIEAYPEAISPYCRLVQSQEAGKRRCIENDRQAFEHASKHPGVYMYRCCFGLYEAVAPLNLLGNSVGYLMMGQCIDCNPDSKKTIIQNGLNYVSDSDSLIAAAEKVPVCEKEKILSCMKILDICAQYIMFSNQFIMDKDDIPDKVKQYIDFDYPQCITIEGICLKFFCSRTSVMKSYKKKYGLGIIEYLTLVRMQTAKRLLTDTAKTIKEVGECCGFADQNYFSKVFMKHCGLTPSAYRKSKV